MTSEHPMTVRTYDPTQPRPFEHLVEIVGIEAAGEMVEAAAPAVAEAGADVQHTGAILLAAIKALRRTSAIVDPADLAELDVYRVGHNQLTIDPMHVGQPIHEVYEYAEGESTYWLQQTHRGQPIWACMVCGRVSVGARSGCGECGTEHGDDLTPLLYETKASCRSWSAMYGGQYDGACLIAGSEGCNCGWCEGVRIAEPGPDGCYVAAPCGATGTHGKHRLDGRDDLLITGTRPYRSSTAEEATR